MSKVDYEKFNALVLHREIKKDMDRVSAKMAVIEEVLERKEKTRKAPRTS